MTGEQRRWTCCGNISCSDLLQDSFKSFVRPLCLPCDEARLHGLDGRIPFLSAGVVLGFSHIARNRQAVPLLSTRRHCSLWTSSFLHGSVFNVTAGCHFTRRTIQTRQMLQDNVSYYRLFCFPATSSVNAGEWVQATLISSLLSTGAPSH